MQYQSFGRGIDGPVTLSGTDSPTDSACSGTSGSTSLSATNASFTAGRLIKIRQERGTNKGKWEINAIASYTAGTITTQFPLSNTYSSSSANRAQVIQIPEYSSVTITGDYTLKPWNDTVGGHLVFACSGRVHTQSGVVVSGKGKGFRGGDREASGGSGHNPAEQGDSPTTTPSRLAINNGSGGGGAEDTSGSTRGASGGGGGHYSSGGSGTGNSGSTAGTAGSTDATADDLVTGFYMGSGGGGGAGPGGNDEGGFGGAGGATYDIYCREWLNEGTWNFKGNDGNTSNNYGSYTNSGNPSAIGSQGAGGGAGSGGAGIVNCQKFENSGTITFEGGTGGASNGGLASGGNGGNGEGVINTCEIVDSGTLTGQFYENKGGHEYCQAFIHIY